MANTPAGGLTSLRVHMGEPGATSDYIVTAWNEVEGLKLKHLIQPKKIGPAGPGEVNFKDLPVVPLHQRVNTFKHMVELIRDVQVDVDLEAVARAMQKSAYMELPEPIKPKEEWRVPFTMQLAVIPPAGGDMNTKPLTIVKHYMFSNQQRVDLFMRKMQQPRSQLYMFDRCPDWFRSFMTFQSLFEKLGGTIYSYKAWPAEGEPYGGKKKLRTPQEITRAYQFMKEEAPRTNVECEQLMWVDFQVNDPDSPVFWMDKTSIFKALEKFSQGSNLVLRTQSVCSRSFAAGIAAGAGVRWGGRRETEGCVHPDCVDRERWGGGAGPTCDMSCRGQGLVGSRFDIAVFVCT